jgi:hypothetical protein
MFFSIFCSWEQFGSEGGKQEKEGENEAEPLGVRSQLELGTRVTFGLKPNYELFLG